MHKPLNIMRSKLISFLEDLKKREVSDLNYSLTINYNSLVGDFRYTKFNINEIIDILDGYKDDITTFNLTLDNYERYDEDRYKKYYYIVRLMFHNDGIHFCFNSKYLSNDYIEVSDIDSLFKIYKKHCTYSKSLYNAIKKQ